MSDTAHLSVVPEDASARQRALALKSIEEMHGSILDRPWPEPELSEDDRYDDRYGQARDALAQMAEADSLSSFAEVAEGIHREYIERRSMTVKMMSLCIWRRV